MKKRNIVILAIGILVLGAAFVFAQKAIHKGFGGRGFGGHPGMGMALRGLDLTDAQKARVKEIMEANKANFQPIMQSLKENHKKLADLTANGGFDEAQVQALATEQGNLTAKMIVERERVKSQVFAILTDEQKAKAAQTRDQMKEHFKNRMKDHDGTEKAPAGSEF